MKRINLAVASFSLVGVAFGQSLPEAIKKTDNERYEEAAKEFRALVAQGSGEKGDIYFFFTERIFINLMI